MNALILKDGKILNCSGRLHETVAKQKLKTTLAKAIESGICRTHWNERYSSFAIDCGKKLTVKQWESVKKIFADVRCYKLVKCIAGKYEYKESYSRIRKIA